MRNQVFVSYSHEDKAWLEKFRTMLKPLVTNEGLTVWDDSRIKAGSKWREEIAANLAASGVALLLVTPSFLASDFIISNELPQLLNAAEQKGLTVIWVAVSDSLYEATSIVHYQAANDPASPLDSLQSAALNRELVRICKKIMDAIAIRPPVAQIAVDTTPVLRNGKSLGEAVEKEQREAQQKTLVSGNVPEKTESLRIAILYKRNVAADEQVLRLLETQLRLLGHTVFIDRHLTIGVKWAEELEYQLRIADAVIPLLSSASIMSEMLTGEVEIAHDAAQKNGKPRILPVRVNFEGPLPGSLGVILNPLQYAVWNRPEEDDMLLSHILTSLKEPDPLKLNRPEVPGGVVPIDSKYYIIRETDRKLMEAINRKDSIVLIKGARQTGKTSLLARGLQEARQQGCTILVTDFQKLNTSSLENIESFYLALGGMIADQLNLDVYPEEEWKPARAPSLNFERYIKRHVLASITQPVVWGMDEVDRLFTTSFGSEVFGLFRSWFNERALLDSPWEKMTLLIVYALEAHLFITDPYQSPFNVGTKLEIRDFTLSQVEDLNFRYGRCLRDRVELERFYTLVGGHPYLVRRALHELLNSRTSLADFAEKADSDEGPFGDHLRRILIMLARNLELWSALREILATGRCSSAEDFYRLRTAGIVTGDSQENVSFRCTIYRHYLEHHLAEVMQELPALR